MKKFYFTLITSALLSTANAQNNVGIGTTAPNPSAALDIESTTQGMLVPRLTTVQRLAIANPAQGLLVYDLTANCFFFYTNTTWQSLCTSSSTPAPTNVGQFAATVYSTAQLTLTPTMTTYQIVPGLSQTITVPAGAKVYVSTNGGMQNTQSSGTNHGTAAFYIYVDGVATQVAGRFVAANTSTMAQFINNWNLSSVLNLSAGQHTIDLRVRHFEGASNLNIGGTSDLIKGNLSVIIIKE